MLGSFPCPSLPHRKHLTLPRPANKLFSSCHLLPPEGLVEPSAAPRRVTATPSVPRQTPAEVGDTQQHPRSLLHLLKAATASASRLWGVFCRLCLYFQMLMEQTWGCFNKPPSSWNEKEEKSSVTETTALCIQQHDRHCPRFGKTQECHPLEDSWTWIYPWKRQSPAPTAVIPPMDAN